MTSFVVPASGSGHARPNLCTLVLTWYATSRLGSPAHDSCSCTSAVCTLWYSYTLQSPRWIHVPAAGPWLFQVVFHVPTSMQPRSSSSSGTPFLCCIWKYTLTLHDIVIRSSCWRRWKAFRLQKCSLCGHFLAKCGLSQRIKTFVRSAIVQTHNDLIRWSVRTVENISLFTEQHVRSDFRQCYSIYSFANSMETIGVVTNKIFVHRSGPSEDLVFFILQIFLVFDLCLDSGLKNSTFEFTSARWQSRTSGSINHPQQERLWWQIAQIVLRSVRSVELHLLQLR